MTKSLATLLLAIWGLAFAGPLYAADEFVIGYLQLKKDPRYAESRTYARYLNAPAGRPYSGARVALDESKFHGTAAGVKFKLDREKEKNTKSLIAEIGKMHKKGVNFFVTDLPANVLEDVAKATAGMDLLLMNISARADRLRGEACQPHMLHVIPSHRMLADALAQYLRFKRWTEVLVLQGESEADQELGKSFAASARKYALEIVSERPFVLSNDPRERAKNNVLLLTGKEDYDVVYVADTDGEFARGVPYQTVEARPVIGSAGLNASAWHWAWERHGAPQLENRFERKAKRPMGGYDWAAWMAVKAIAYAVQRTESADFATLRDFLLGPEADLDAFKGPVASFRPWNNQLRQPLLLVTDNWVVARAPLEGYEHRLNDLDTLGHDKPESPCRF